MRQFEIIFIPICVTTERERSQMYHCASKQSSSRGQHWMLLAADVRRRTVSILNSVRSATYDAAMIRYMQLFTSVYIYEQFALFALLIENSIICVARWFSG